ncbi:dioxygenase [Microbacterium xanthum]|uniref:dioxygenase n=1 Tax=Microbacterium xanthum TaxID=3079794 RepID=UPI002AD2ADBC|nr:MULTISPECIES: dioxygenase [unclassified Microbacterium]MDZ8172756.1 dioxygenase [Microbacterium sp. KSW-48]MDZ8202406.1 dioxygenase [Microbacterium sp. SSW1-59]
MPRNDRRNREERQRTRLYEARRRFHDDRIARRTRDNLVAGLGGGVILVAIISLQTLYFTAGPGAPTPEPTGAVVTDPAPSPSPSSSDRSPTPETSATP